MMLDRQAMSGMGRIESAKNSGRYRLYKPEYRTVLEAAEHGDIEDVLRHLRQGEDMNVANSEGWTPLMLAAYVGHMALLRLLLDQGVAVDSATQTGVTALMIALHNRRWEAARLLVEYGADVNRRSVDGRTPLTLAVRHGNPQVMQWLLSQGGGVHAHDRLGRPPLMKVERLEQRTGFQRPDLRGMLTDHGARE